MLDLLSLSQADFVLQDPGSITGVDQAVTVDVAPQAADVLSAQLNAAELTVGDQVVAAIADILADRLTRLVIVCEGQDNLDLGVTQLSGNTEALVEGISVVRLQVSIEDQAAIVVDQVAQRSCSDVGQIELVGGHDRTF